MAPSVSQNGFGSDKRKSGWRNGHALRFDNLMARAGHAPYFRAVTVLEVIQRSAEFLEKKGVESPRLQVELLLARALGLERMGLYLNFGRTVTELELEQVREWVRRRGLREPLQHILGSTCFCGIDLAVNNSVLVPRPETEQLAEPAWQFLNAAAAQPAALDFGTGSGCLAIALAIKSPAARLTAVDVSPEALAVARQNAERHRVLERINFLAGDGFAALPPDARFDLIVSNPPYIPSAEIATLEPEVRDHDPRTALDGGADGLDFYRRIAADAPPFLQPGGRIMLELGDGQSGPVREILEAQKWVVAEVRPDYTGCPRILIADRSDSAGLSGERK
jgi:release factor glutamine methyltransferase